MIRYLTRMEGAKDQVVLFTLVELMTHLIFLALILGIALRKEADPVYVQLTEKCGADGSRCIVKPKLRTDGEGDGENKIVFGHCRGENKPFAEIRAQGDGRFEIRPVLDADPELSSHPLVRPLMRQQLVTSRELRKIGEPLRAAANRGDFGTPCNITVRLCRAHGDAGLWDTQRALATQFFLKVGPNACR